MRAPLRFDPETLPIARLGRPHGVSGELNVHLFNPDSELFARLLPPVTLFIEDESARPAAPLASLTVVGLRPTQRAWLVRFAGVDGRARAEPLVGGIVRVSRNLLPPLLTGEYYPEDLPGCSVADEGGAPLGIVTGVFSNGAHRVLSVVAPDGAERLVPAVSGHLLSVDTSARRLVVRVHEAIEVRS